MTNTEITHLRGIARDFSQTTHDERNSLITNIAESLLVHKAGILGANEEDLKKIDKNDPLYDRVTLSEKRVEGMATACHELTVITDPLSDKYIQTFETGSPIKLISKPVPLGVVACIYEARPNVTVDLAILCIKS
jgi:glutamate-5-semialdehyde dehydrogenase